MNDTEPKPESSPHLFLYCTAGQWQCAVCAGVVLTALAWPWYREVSYWVAPVVLLMTITTCHLSFASRLTVPFPHIAILIAGLQYVLAAWLSFYYPPRNPAYDIGERMPVYLAFGAAATIAYAFGWGAALLGKQGYPCPTTLPPRSLLTELDVLFWFGLACGFSARILPIESLGFLLLLLANLRFVGALGRMLVKGQGWEWRVGLTLLIEILLATRAGMFHTLLLWCAAGFAVYFYRFRLRNGIVLAWILMGLLLLPAFQEAKWRVRERIWFGGGMEVSVAGQGSIWNPVLWIQYLGEGLYRSVTLSWEPEFLSDMAVRYNQGWIINQVMQVVPQQEPYARGETLIAAAKSALLLRVLAPEKFVAGGKLHMARFADREMEGASMNLGYAGELYANFGTYGGIAGCFVYAALLGLAFRWVASRAERSPLWWVFLPYVGAFAFKAEEGIAEVLNWILKAVIVSAAVCFFLPAVRAALSGRPDVATKGRRASGAERVAGIARWQTEPRCRSRAGENH